MKVTKFNILKKMATYNEELSGIGLAASIRKWHEAYYLIKRGYTLLDMKDLCGLCLERPSYEGCSASKCPLRDTEFCNTILNMYKSTKINIKDVHSKWKYLKQLENKGEALV